MRRTTTISTASVGNATTSPSAPSSRPITSTDTIVSTGGKSTFFDITSGETRLPSISRAEKFVPLGGKSIPVLREAAKVCKGCDLYKKATQTVFGEGAKHAPMMLVGEQPGDQEDRIGRPFVGPAGKLLDEALAEVGIDRATVYVTNIVKHFKWSPKFSDVHRSVENSVSGNDGWAVKEGITRYSHACAFPAAPVFLPMKHMCEYGY